ncbi:MAG TPA: hypothetical protein VL914_07605 [Vicinamibacterales bacterium]|jgi:hypothetical protein|nr:hypothetical protein [Vicinamibacterales bacterium]
MAIFERRPSNVLAAALALAALASASVASQSRNVETRTAARTPWGDPDLQGVWSIATITPFERPRALADKQVLTAEEAEEIERTNLATNNQDRRDGAGTDADLARAYNDFWWDRGTKVVSTRQTSLVVDPPDGRVPALTAEGQKRATERAARGYDSWEDRSLWERCITRGLPMIPGPYNNNYQILQTPGYVVILHEMIHDARIIPLDTQPHIGKNIRQWFGDSRGKWEGDTLVVDTTNFADKASYRGSTDGLHLIERFTRINAETVRYEFTIDDPTTFTKRWTTSIPMQHTDEQIYEYACHEGNYGMVNLLSGARAQEKAAEGK